MKHLGSAYISELQSPDTFPFGREVTTWERKECQKQLLDALRGHLKSFPVKIQNFALFVLANPKDDSMIIAKLSPSLNLRKSWA